ncbi:ATP-grasp domain-containing protein [Roseofilum capinflatum]|uniref:ATP-grasp domain-containing protein n=1 Tax=Roseofilum capinflatum BLCC-M114 TaxID=3022440 RepID=A0ABT7B630_9CYAN|nr:ATP-grasp domain-containing protein [Roseofilum capinflatum]MDJ1174627.1 ATP-grasp domain-containing protein [Roseofilum capinflatum BLCC-M114]
MESIPILVICPRAIDYLNCQTIPEAEKYQFHFLDAPLELSGFSQNFDVINFLEECRQYIKQHEIKVVLATRDIPSLLQAQLSQEFEHLRGPSIDSSFICLHKYYTHQKINFPSSDYTLCWLEPNKSLSESVRAIDIPFPWMLKPCTGACSSSIMKIPNEQEAQNAIAFYQEFVVDNLKYLNPFLETYLDGDRYPLIKQNPILVEEYIDSPYKCCVDGCVSHGEILIWGISDSHYYANKPDCFADYSFPSTLPQLIQDKLKESYKKIVKTLIDYGFDNQFVDVEFFVSDNGEIKIMEINGRMIPISASLYRQCLNQGDPYSALISIGMGDRPKAPTLNGLVGGIFYLTTFAKDRAENLFDFELAEKFDNIEIRVNPKQEIAEISPSGFTLATVNLVGNSYEVIHEKANNIRRKLLKRPNFSPWN